MVRTRTQFHNHSAEEKREYVQDILLSKFVLCPRGWSPATYRLFEVMELGRCPVIISDDWVPIDGVPWQDCCLVIRQKDVASCANILGEQKIKRREIRESRSRGLGIAFFRCDEISRNAALYNSIKGRKRW